MRLVLAMLIVFTPFSARALSRAEGDARSVEIYRAGLHSAVADVRMLATKSSGKILGAEEKEAVRATWSSFLDYLLALDSIGAYHREQKGERAMVVTYAAFLAQYRAALEIIEATSELPGIDEVLNEEVPGIGLPAHSYARVKFRWLNVARATEYAALESLYRIRGGDSFPQLRARIGEDSKYVLSAGKGMGPAQTAANAMKIAKSSAFTGWFPVQKGVAEWMGDTRVARADRFHVTAKQIAEIAPSLQPGDIFLERREWYVSNIGLPGYWPHTALYIGDVSHRMRYFDDPDVRTWLREQGRADGDFEAYLRTKHPVAYAKSNGGRVIEAISEGVSFTTLEHSAAADTFAVLRPRATKRQKAIAIDRAFGFIGRPYDFNFDFHTDSSLVCSEVIYKAYEGAVSMPLMKQMGRIVTPPNEIVRAFDATFRSEHQQFDFVLFLDGHERKRAALPASVDDFRESWKRPKWFVMKQ